MRLMIGHVRRRFLTGFKEKVKTSHLSIRVDILLLLYGEHPSDTRRQPTHCIL
jgi:hypothetical protein